MDREIALDIDATGPHGALHLEGHRVRARDERSAEAFLREVLREQGYRDIEITVTPAVEPPRSA